MYAIIRTGGKRYRVAEGDFIKVEKVEDESGSSVVPTPVLLVDSVDIVADADKLINVTVNAEIVEAAEDPKIRGMYYKNKIGYKRRYGHRQPLTVLKITGVPK